MWPKIKTEEIKKKGVSLMISYVLLISIAIALAIAIFSWLNLISNVEPLKECNEGTSLILSSYYCNKTEHTITISVKNNGRFNIDGFILAITNDTKKIPDVYLKPNVSATKIKGGYWYFYAPLKPGNINATKFEMKEEKIEGEWEDVDFKYIRIIKLQPFIKYKDRIIVCEDAVIEQEIKNCQVKT